MKRCLVVLGLGLAVVCCAQPHGPETRWTRTYEISWQGTVWDLALLPTGDLAAVGSVSYGNPWDTFVFTTDNVGDSLAFRTYGVPAREEYATKACVTLDGGLSISGDYFIPDPDSMSRSFLLRLSPDGIQRWYTLCGTGDQFHAPTPDGGFVMPGDSGTSVFLIRLDGNGSVQWSHTYEFGSLARVWDVAVAADGSIFVCGEAVHEDGGQNRDAFVLKTDAEGSQIFLNRFGGSGREVAYCIQPLADQGCAIIGGTTTPNPVNWSTYVARLTTSGDTLWTRTTLSGIGYGYKIRETLDGGLVGIDLVTDTVTHENTLRLWRWDLTGQVQWVNQYPFVTDWMPSMGLCADPQGRYVLCTGSSYMITPLIIYTERDPTLASTPHRSAHSPNEFDLKQNYPNPFNPTTEIRFDLPKTELVRLKVFDVLGKEVAVLEDGMVVAGNHAVTFDGSARPSGVYFVRLEAGKAVRTEKMMLLK